MALGMGYLSEWYSYERMRALFKIGGYEMKLQLTTIMFFEFSVSGLLYYDFCASCFDEYSYENAEVKK